MIISKEEQPGYISVLYPNTKDPWIYFGKVKENAIIYWEKDLESIEKVLKKRKINYSLNKIKQNGKPPEHTASSM